MARKLTIAEEVEQLDGHEPELNWSAAIKQSERVLALVGAETDRARKVTNAQLVLKQMIDDIDMRANLQKQHLTEECGKYIAQLYG